MGQRDQRGQHAHLYRLDGRVLHDFRHGTAGHIGAGGFSESGLPIGVQIVGKPRGDLELLRIARAFETATEHGLRSPNLDTIR